MIGGGTAGTNRASAATFAETLIAGSDGTVLLRADLDFAGSVDNLTVARVAIVPGADVTTGGGVELNPATRYLGTRTGGIDAISLISPNAGNVTMAFYTV